MMDILIHNAFANNLKNVNAKLPVRSVIGIAGVSGSGKSTLVKDILSAYGAQNYALSLPMFERGFVANKEVLPVGSIENLPATLMIDVINSVNNPNSTLSTITGIHSLLRELYHKFGVYKCPVCYAEIENDIYTVLSQVPHTVFAEVKCDSRYSEKVSAIKENFDVKRIAYYNSNDEPQSRKAADGYVRFYLGIESSNTKATAQTLKRCANITLRAFLLETKEIVDLRTHTICRRCHAVIPKKSMGLFSFNVPRRNGGGACMCCSGSGRILACDEQKLIKRNIPMNQGGIPTITDKGIQYTTVTEKFLDSIASNYCFSWSNTFDELTEQQKKVILDGTKDTIAFTDRRGANGGKKAERFLGFRAYTVESYRAGKGSTTLINYVHDKICPACGGNRLDRITDQITYRNTTLRQLLSISLHELGEIIDSWCASATPNEKMILSQIRTKLAVYEEVGCDYLELNRQSTTLSGGELQRLRLCSFFSSNITNACILLDEPTTGLHQKDIERLALLLHRLKTMGHTVILIEHNRQILSTCDYILELGPGGGSEGGTVLSSGWLNGTNNDHKKFGILRKTSYASQINTNPCAENKMIHIHDFSALYIKHQSVAFPKDSLIAVCGVSGSGKSTFVNYCLIPYLSSNSAALGIKRIENLGQKNATRTSTSNVGSLLGVNDRVSQLFAKTSGLNKRDFMLNAAEGKCPVCNGKGKILLEDEVEDVCPNCEGRMFSDAVLEKKYHGLNILDFLQTPVNQLIPLVAEDKKIGKIFSLCEQIGVGYLSLSRTSRTLSKGEIQRIKLVNVLSNAEKGNIYVLDEPSKGLHPSDINKLVNMISEIIKCGNTVIAVEHNVDFISCCNYAIEFGPSSGKNGGKVVFSGDIQAFMGADTSTGHALMDAKLAIGNSKNFGTDAEEYIEYIKLLGENEIRYQHINYVDIHPKTLNRLFTYTNSEYLNVTLPASTFFAARPDDEDNQLNGCKLPIIRPVGISGTTFGKKARIVDAVGLYSQISRYFLPIEARTDLGDQFKPDAFSPGSSVGKCPVCKGSGELEQFDFDLVFTKGAVCPSIEALLKKRTNYVIAKKYLKRDHNLDIFRPYDELTEEERTVLLFGDRRRKFYDKGKEYYWEGLNRLVTKELRYLADDLLAEKIRSSKGVHPCIACKGSLLDKKYRLMIRSELKYNELVTYSFQELLQQLHGCDNVDKCLLHAINILVTLGLGEYNFFTRVSALNKDEQGLVQLTAYLIHPIHNSIIAIDGKIIKENSAVKTMLQEATKNCTIVISEREEV